MKTAATVLCMALMLFVPNSRQRVSARKTAPQNTIQENKKEPRAEIEARIAEADKNLHALELQKNYVIWQKFIRDSERSEKNIRVFALKDLNIGLMADTIPEIKTLRTEFLKQDSALVAVLSADPEYVDLRKKYTEAKGDKELRDSIQQKIYAVYKRLAASDPDYVIARRKRDEALFVQNLEIARALTLHYTQREELVPFEDIISAKYLSNIQDMNPIRDINSDITEIKSLKEELQRKLLQ